MKGLTPGSNRARFLEACSGEPRNVEQLLQQADPVGRMSEVAGRKIIDSLLKRGLIARAAVGTYILTPAGEDELDHLFKHTHPELFDQTPPERVTT
ncbi:hypothetical protein [Deinococcus ruber]|uniref:Uncharacterized protein n=1 Tax=Deinococcus ruber TaxID=1848197 RepID=A0A918C986_9DEIO|nr:hypothetical protein [Deinococcus ruber]GGR11538.1 hypothetical protein GCM10008957_25590 [Deinococcus ruber]